MPAEEAAGPNLYFFVLVFSVVAAEDLGGVLSAGVVLVVVVVLVVGVVFPVVDHEGAVGVVVLEVVVVLDEVVAEGGADLKRARLHERAQKV